MNNAIVGSSGHKLPGCHMPTPPPPARRHYEAFTPVQQTLIIPLVARALGGGLYPGHACGDEQASRLLRTLEIDGQAYLADRPTVLNVLWRTRLIRECAQAFFAKYPKAWGINLAAG
jgi:O-methyltransferase involved in polyketide biosynthesis